MEPDKMIETVQNSSVGEVSVSWSGNSLSSEGSKGNHKRNNRETKGELHEVHRSVRELGISGETTLEEFQNISCPESKLARVKLVGEGNSLQVVPNSSFRDISVNHTYSELASEGNARSIVVKKVKEIIHGNGVPEVKEMSMLGLNTSGEHLTMENQDELSKNQKNVKEHESSARQSVEEFSTYHDKGEIFSWETGNIKERVPGSLLDLTHEQSNSSQSCRQGFNTTLKSVDNIFIGESSTNYADTNPGPSKGVQKKKKKVEPAVHESTSNPLPTQLEQGNEEIVSELEQVTERCHILSKGNLEVSTTECKMEEILPFSCDGNVLKHVSVGSINKEEYILEKLPSLSEISPGGTRRKLLILDLNGLLVDIVPFAPSGYTVDAKIAFKSLFKRPFCGDFLKFCFERFEVGVWSSRNKRNVDSVVDFLMGDMRHKLLFCWDQSHCTETGFRTIENKKKPLVLKELKKLWDKHDPNLPWEKGEYNESNTLLVDDSPYKALCNPQHTAIFPYPFTYWDRNDDFLGPGGDLRRYLEALAMSEDVQKYVEEHPFGQHAITSKDPSWDFYLKVIGTKMDDVQPEDNVDSSSLTSRQEAYSLSSK
ncbi:hypothetical protein NE237_019613 [Protea cynaroides]|uniref:Mitochondrial import inner membrane translocase subunit TIM50 n=1 Tax=Protea cynaroides TaxID=273540 RepID=A0A9Q0K342_9MAGN|nr:hypothetical protein NE237_019613 [Protea cynaroides]